MAAGRAGTKAQKTKAEVRGGGSKPWSRKARAGARRLDPQPDLGRRRSRVRGAAARLRAESQPQDVPRRDAPMLSELARQERLVVIERLELEAPKTKLLARSSPTRASATTCWCSIEAYDEKLELAARNLPYVDVLPVRRVDPVSLARHAESARDGRCGAHARGEARMSQAKSV